MKVRWAIGAFAALLARAPLVSQDDCCSAPLNLGFSTTVVRGAPAFEGVDGVGPACEARLGVVDHTGAAPQKVYVNLVTQLDSKLPYGVAGWSLSIRLEGDGELLSATTAGTAGDWWDRGGLFEGGFHRTEIIDPARNEGRKGAVSALVLDLDGHPHIFGESTESVLALELSGPEGSTSDVSVFDGLRGRSQPVMNAVTVAGESRNVCNVNTARISIRHLALDNFIRGNANGDALIDISDALWILNSLFRESRPSACADASDANDDGRVDISDPIQLIEYLFLTGTAPPAPFVECGLDRTEDEIGCPGGSPTC
jgi:hypothetical protein